MFVKFTQVDGYNCYLVLLYSISLNEKATNYLIVLLTGLWFFFQFGTITKNGALNFLYLSPRTHCKFLQAIYLGKELPHNVMLFSKVTKPICTSNNMTAPVAPHTSQYLMVLECLLYFFNSKKHVFLHSTMSENGMPFTVIIYPGSGHIKLSLPEHVPQNLGMNVRDNTGTLFQEM